jgi:hypothetical protein
MAVVIRFITVLDIHQMAFNGVFSYPPADMSETGLKYPFKREWTNVLLIFGESARGLEEVLEGLLSTLPKDFIHPQVGVVVVVAGAGVRVAGIAVTGIAVAGVAVAGVGTWRLVVPLIGGFRDFLLMTRTVVQGHRRLQQGCIHERA